MSTNVLDVSGNAIISGILSLTSTIPPTSNQVIPVSTDNTTRIPTTAWVQTAISSAIPIGGIIMWSSVTVIPSNYALCNGSNGTPNLRDRFIVGAGSTYAVAAIGGAARVTLTTAEIPAHSHNINDPGHVHTFSGIGDDGNGSSQQKASIVGYDQNFSSQFTSQMQIATTGISLENTGGDGNHENLPPYYALAYIMRMR